MAKINNMMSILWMLSSDKKVTAKQTALLHAAIFAKEKGNFFRCNLR